MVAVIMMHFGPIKGAEGKLLGLCIIEWGRIRDIRLLNATFK